MRELTALNVVLEEASFTLALERRKDSSDKDHLDRLSREYMRKLDRVSNSSFFSVAGMPTLSDDPPDRIFDVIFCVPYELDKLWEGKLIGTIGGIALTAPGAPPWSNGPAVRQPGTGANKSTKRSRRVKPVVRFHILVRRRAKLVTAAYVNLVAISWGPHSHEHCDNQ